ncbi:hypothetical protein AT728_16295 [Streptomyces silvensis]|uniref:Uncharacterized protein n=2 Tax=Streptomyces silvensis TaxID=1765722 RepID=A0A0W7X3V7_9ACTN|nr:hypothetical protein AT728_16295 [Streptomyces silvensis]
MSAPEPVKLSSDEGEPYMLTVPHAPVTDARLSAADVGTYMRCRWLTDICAPYGDLDWLIGELRMPEAQTRESVRRLVELGYLNTVGPVELEAVIARDMAGRIREAIEATVDELTPAERKALARVADLVDRRQARATEALAAQQRGGPGPG